MKKIMIYCQHLAGMGHLVRSTEIIRSLLKTFKVCFVSGGQIVPDFQLPDGIETVYLPALWQQGDQLQPLNKSLSLADVTAQRQRILLETFDRFEPDCFITECFPFSKLKLKPELSPVLKRAKNSARPVKIICSLRDIIMTQPMPPDARSRRQDKIRHILARYYDAVLFHSDKNFQPLEKSFPHPQGLPCKLIYTGYVAQRVPQDPVTGSSEGSPTIVASIVASVGGGRHGYPLLQAILQAAPDLADPHLATHGRPHHITAFAGPFMPDKDFASLQRQAADKPNVTLRRYTTRLMTYLKQADLSVSLGGYNTTMNLLRTGVRSLVLPSPSKNQTDEQRMRAQMLAELGVIGLLKPEQLAPEPLVRAILDRLKSTPSSQRFNLNGADNTAQYLQQCLSEQATAKTTAAKQAAAKQAVTKQAAAKHPLSV